MRADSGDRHGRRSAGAEDQDSRRRGISHRRDRDWPAGAGARPHQGGFGAEPGHSAVRRQLHSLRWRSFAALQRFEAGLDHYCRDRHDRRHHHRRHHRHCRPLHPGCPLDRGAAAGRDAGLDRSGNAGSDFPSGPYSRSGGANRDERIRLQRRHGRHRHLRRAGGGDGNRRVLVCLLTVRSAEAIRDRHRRRGCAGISGGASHLP